MKLGKKEKDSRPPDWLSFLPTRLTGNDFLLKDRQQEMAAVLSWSHLKALCAFAPNALYVYYI